MAHPLRRLLMPFGALYGGVVMVRNIGYDGGLFKVKKLPVPVVSVGNISVGGSGKTPFTMFLVDKLLSMGKKPGVLSLGYKRLSDRRQISFPSASLEVDVQLLGDEPALISRSFPNVPVAADRDRYAAGVAILKKFEVDVFILDDGLQNRELHHDLDFVLMPNSLGDLHENYLPTGNLRDWKGRLRQANVMVLTAHGRYEVERKRLDELSGYTDAPVAGVSFIPSGFVDYAGTKFNPEFIKKRTIAAFCGIAGPQQFFDSLESMGGLISIRTIFRDHHWFDEYDIDEIFGGDEEIAAITTAKDAVRIFDDEVLASKEEVRRIYALQEETVVNFGLEHIENSLSNLFERIYA